MPESVGLAIIARDEAKRLPTLLASIEGCFDEVVLVDTGSSDDTVQVFIDWVNTQEGIRGVWDEIEWTDDFSAARRHAQSLQTTDWEVWADCDDIIAGAQNIRQLIANAPTGIVGFICGYQYITDPNTGNCLCYLKRERIVRRGHGVWQNRVHEAQVLDGAVQMVPPNIVEWVHKKQFVEAGKDEDTRRNIKILEQWVKDEPDNTRVLVYLGVEIAAHGEHEEALVWFDRYFAANPQWDEERAQAHRKTAVSLLVLGRYDEAEQHALRALTVMPSWPDSYLTMSEVALARGEWAKAAEWAKEAVRRGTPDTLLIINPLDYTFHPRKLYAKALAEMGKFEEAVHIGQEAWGIASGDPGLQAELPQWMAKAKTERTVETFVSSCQLLIGHDEQLKALTLIEQCIPHFCVDHPRIVAMRASLRERIEWIKNPRALLDHYENGGSKPEDFLPEDQVDKVAASLPRTEFLYQGIHEQLLEMRREGLIQEVAAEQIGQALESVNG